MTRVRFTGIFSLLFVFCGHEPEINPNLYATWVVVGMEYTTAGTITYLSSYRIDETLLAYTVGSGTFTEYARGQDLSPPPFYGTIEMFDSVRTKAFSADITEGAIAISGGGTIAYSLSEACGADFLKLTRTQTGYDPSFGPVAVEIIYYCLKTLQDSLPGRWPAELDVQTPDSLCNPDELPFSMADSWQPRRFLPGSRRPMTTNTNKIPGCGALR